MSTTLKKKLAVCRAVLQRTVTSYKDLGNEDTVAHQVKFNLIVQKGSELENLHIEYMEALYNDTDKSEEDILREQLEIDTYTELLENVKLLHSGNMLPEAREEDIQSNTANDNLDEDVVSSAAAIRSPTTAAVRLPKIKLREFDVTTQTWCSFWSQFSKIHFDPTIAAEDKFLYLLMSMKENTKARSLVENFSVSSDNYHKVIDTIKNRFGRPDMVINSIHAELLQIVASKPSISDLYDKLNSKIKSLQSLGLSKENLIILLPLIEDCLNPELFRVWERIKADKRKCNGNNGSRESLASLGTADILNDFDELLLFLETEVNTEERLIKAGSVDNDVTSGKFTAVALHARDGKISKPPRDLDVLAEKGYRKYCIFCKQDHDHESKDCSVERSLDEKREKVREAKVCFSCLKPSHFRHECRSRVFCQHCRGRHFEVMCGIKHGTVPTSGNKVFTGFAGSIGKPAVVMKTLLVKVYNGQQDIIVRALLDDGSQRSYISEAVSRKLGLASEGSETLYHSLFGGVTTAGTNHNKYKIFISGVDSTEKMEVTFLGENKICDAIPTFNDKNTLLTLNKRGIRLSDCGANYPILMLLGANYMGALLTGRMERVSSWLAAIQTRVGWCMVGMTNEATMVDVVASMSNYDVPNLWQLETLGIESAVNKNVHEGVEYLLKFNETTEFDSELGKYVVTLPWLENHPPIPTNRELAQMRLNQVIRRLNKMNMLTQYDEVLSQWENEGIIEQVRDKNNFLNCHYLPHRPVFKAGKTKIRPVFDASAKRQGGVSLNECLAAGPNLITQIIPMLIRFRLQTVGVVGDIKAAFLQIGLKNEDRDMLRFLWVRNGEISIFRHKRVVFGVTSSPFLLGATIRHHLDRKEFLEDVRSNVVEMLKDSFYVDDCLRSFCTREEALQFKEQATSVMQEAGFELRGWVTSGDFVTQSVLGIIWQADADVLRCALPKVDVEPPITKKSLLSIIGRVYDPLGFLAAPLLTLKILLQDIFLLKTPWDAPLTSEFRFRCSEWLHEINIIDNLCFPRCIQGEGTNCSIHVFSDASARGLGACIFLRCEVNSEVRLRFVCAKARVAPIGEVSIPRKELLAAGLAARLANTARQGLGGNDKITYWSDSVVTLHWIKGNGCNWKPFVSNRVKEIRNLTEETDWRFVNGNKNPADLLSRGCLLREFSDRKWWEGPQWLLDSPDSWPTDEISTCLLTQDTNGQEAHQATEMFVYFSSFKRNVRVVAWMLRWKYKSQSETLTSEELIYAEKRLVFSIQNQNAINTDLETILDKDGLIRVKTKIVAEEFKVEFRTPILLAPCALVEAMVREKHEDNYHALSNILLGILREEYWIHRGRRLVRKVLSKCVKCQRYKAKAVETQQPTLPDNRVSMKKVFDVTGCDLAGPLFVKDGSKVWIVLFTCAVYRAVHLEIVDSLSTETFVRALRKFVARRGRVSVMYTDNGSNFQGLSNLLDLSEVEEHENIPRMKWIFNPPAAPWWGGWFERLVGVVKQRLKTSLGRAMLTRDELYTVIVEVEAVVNSRPITYVSDDIHELRPLTPSMFLQEQTEVNVPELDEIDQRSLNFRIRYISNVRMCLKERFRQEYLGALAVHHQRVSKPLKIGDIVWIGADNKKRQEWVLGRIVELFAGRDEVFRTARVKTAKGEVLRAVQRLFPLEIEPVSSLNENASYQNDNSSESNNVSRSGRLIKKPQRLDL